MLRHFLLTAGLAATSLHPFVAYAGETGDAARTLPPRTRTTASADLKAIFPEGGCAAIYHEGWIDLNKNGVKDPYENPSVEIEKRIDDLLARMTTDEKTGQLCTLYAYQLKGAAPDDSWLKAPWKDGMGNMDEQLNKVADFGDRWRIGVHNHGMNVTQRFFIEKTRLGIPVDFSNEGIAGVKYPKSTGFPRQIGLGASFDRDLVRKVGEITAREGAALGYTNVYSPILDVNRDQRWGRYDESYGECPFLVSELGYEQVTAMQANGVASTPKHFAVYALSKGARGYTAQCDAQCGPRDLEMIHMWPWRHAIRDGRALGIMTSYNDWDGVCVSGSSLFLTDKLRKEYGFAGYAVSDSSAVKKLFNQHHIASSPDDAIRMYLEAGGNVKTDFDPPAVFLDATRRLVADGRLSMKVVDERVRDVLRVKFWLGLFDNPYCGTDDQAAKVVACAEHEAIALRAAREALVLLKNDKAALPIDRKTIKRIAVVGPNADYKMNGKFAYGSNDPDVVSVTEGIRRLAGPGVTVVSAKGCDHTAPGFPETESYPRPMTGKERDGIDAAVKLCADADVIVAVLGDSSKTVGESRERTSLDLPGRQDDLLRALQETGKPVALVVYSGRPMSFNRAAETVPAILQAWQPGPHAGTAIAEALFGDYNPGGKSPGTYPRSVGQLPMNFPFKPGSQAPSGSPMARLDGVLYSFGHGLSYTTFKYSDLKVEPAVAKINESIQISFTVRNTGKVAGDEVPQLYLREDPTSVTTYEKNLRGFSRIRLEPGEARTVTYTVEPDKHLWLIDTALNRVVEPGTVKVMVGSASDDIRLNGKFLLGLKPDTKADNDSDKAVSSGFVPGHAPASAVDGKPDTFWQADAVSDSWIELRLGGTKAISRVNLVWGPGRHTGRKFEVQIVSAIGSWETVASGIASENPGAQTVTFPVRTTESLRVVFPANIDPATLREVSVEK